MRASEPDLVPSISRQPTPAVLRAARRPDWRLVGIPARKDIAAAGRWVGTYNALVRGMAQRWQIPFVDLHGALADLPGLGLSGDKLHLNSHTELRGRPAHPRPRRWPQAPG